MAIPKAAAPIECAVLKSSDTAAASGLFAKVFSAAEPPAVAMGLTVPDLEEFVGLLCPRAVEEGLTIVARSQETGEVAGAMLTDDFAMPSEIKPAAFSQKFLPILAMLDTLDEPYRKGRDIRVREYLHLFMLAVDPRYAGRGIAKQLVSACLENGRAKGYKYAVTEATGTISQRVFRQLGFREQVRASYQEYRYQGRAVFASIRDHEAAILMDRTIGE